MVFKQILLAFALLFVAFFVEVSRRIITGDQPTTFFYGNFLWILLFVSAQPPFLNHSLRKLYKPLALIVGFIAAVTFDSLIGPLLMGAIFAMIKGTPTDAMGSLFSIIILLKMTSILVGYLASKATVKMMSMQTGASTTMNK